MKIWLTCMAMILAGYSYGSQDTGSQIINDASGLEGLTASLKDAFGEQDADTDGPKGFLDVLLDRSKEARLIQVKNKILTTLLEQVPSEGNYGAQIQKLSDREIDEQDKETIRQALTEWLKDASNMDTIKEAVNQGLSILNEQKEAIAQAQTDRAMTKQTNPPSNNSYMTRLTNAGARVKQSARQTVATITPTNIAKKGNEVIQGTRGALASITPNQVASAAKQGADVVQGGVRVFKNAAINAGAGAVRLSVAPLAIGR